MDYEKDERCMPDKPIENKNKIARKRELDILYNEVLALQNRTETTCIFLMKRLRLLKEKI